MSSASNPILIDASREASAGPALGSLRSRFVSGAFWSLVGAALARGLSLAAAMFAGRLLGPTHYGELGMVQSTQGLFAIFAGAGLGLAATKHVAEFRARDASKAGRCVALSLRIAVGTGLLGTLVLLLLSNWLANRVLHAPQLTLVLRVASGLVLVRVIAGVQTGALAGLERFRVIAGIGVIRGTCLVFATVVGVQLAGILGAVIALVLAEAVGVAGNWVALGRHCPRHEGPLNWRELLGIGRFSLFALVSSLATIPALWFGNLVLVGQQNGYTELGVFNAAERWRQALLFLPASLSSAVLAILSNLHGSRDGLSYRKVVGINLSLTLVAVVLPAVGLMLLARPAMWLFGEQYESGRITLILLAASAVFYVLNAALGQLLVSQGAIGLRMALDLLLAALLAGVAWRLIPVYQADGLALAHLAAYSAATLALLLPAWYYWKQAKVKAAADIAFGPEAEGQP